MTGACARSARRNGVGGDVVNGWKGAAQAGVLPRHIDESRAQTERYGQHAETARAEFRPPERKRQHAQTNPEAGISQYKPKLYGHQPSRQPNGATASRTRAMTDRTIAVPGPVLDKSMRTPAVNAAPKVGFRTPLFNLQG